MEAAVRLSDIGLFWSYSVRGLSVTRKAGEEEGGGPHLLNDYRNDKWWTILSQVQYNLLKIWIHMGSHKNLNTILPLDSFFYDRGHDRTKRITVLCLVTGQSQTFVWWLTNHRPLSGGWPITDICLVADQSQKFVLWLSNHRPLSGGWPITPLFWWLTNHRPLSGGWPITDLCLVADQSHTLVWWLTNHRPLSGYWPITDLLINSYECMLYRALKCS